MLLLATKAAVLQETVKENQTTATVTVSVQSFEIAAQTFTVCGASTDKYT